MHFYSVTDRTRNRVAALAMLALALGTFRAFASEGDDAPTVLAGARTPSVDQYEDAPRTPDVDDPAIWADSSGERSLVIGTLKDAGLQVYDVRGNVVQTVAPPNRPALAAADPPVPGATPPEPATTACPESASGETFGRFNNVEVVHDFPLREGRAIRRVDLAVVTDRGCDRVRAYAILPERTDGPLIDVTDADVPRVFPDRIVQPSPFQPIAEPVAGLQPNPLDAEDTAYGLATFVERDRVHAFVSQRSRSRIAQLELVATAAGSVSYRPVREFRFPTVFTIPAASDGGTLRFSPCREDPVADPQFEGLAVDADLGILYASQELVGVWKLIPSDALPRVVNVPQRFLIEPVKGFGQAFFAVPDGDEFACEREAPLDENGQLPLGTIVTEGNPAVAGEHIEADAEGVTIYRARGLRGFVLVSSQGDGTIQMFERRGGFTRRTGNRFVTAFSVDGVGETDGVDVVNVPVDRAFPLGLFVLQNGDAPPPADTRDINGFEYDGSTQLVLVGWEAIVQSARPTLRIDPRPLR
jgi:3-phytase